MGIKFFMVNQGGIGDVLLSTPILAGVKKKYPGSRNTLMVSPHAVDLVSGLSCVDEVYSYDEKKKPFWEMWRKMRGHDVSFHFSLTYRPTVVAALAGIPVRIGLEHKRGFWLTRGVKWRESMDHTYEPFVMADILKEGGMDLRLSEEELSQLHAAEASKEEKASLAALLQDKGMKPGEPYVACSPLTTSRLKDWELAKWDELFSRIYKTFGLRTVIFGSGDIPFAWTGNAVVSLLGRLALRQVGEIVKNASLLVNSCSLPLHLAAAFHTPCVALYGFTDPARWAPRANCEVVRADLPCSPCDSYLGSDCSDPKCMRAISVDQVFEVCAKMLASN